MKKPAQFKTTQAKRDRNTAWRRANPDKMKGYIRKWKKNNPDKVREQDIKWCKANPEKVKQKRKTYCENHPEEVKGWKRDFYYAHHNQILLYWKNRREIFKLAALSYYSKGSLTCKCCGEYHVDFLTIDHIGGGGRKHRTEIGCNGGGTAFIGG